MNCQNFARIFLAMPHSINYGHIDKNAGRFAELVGG